MELNTCLIRDQPSLLLHGQFKLIHIESVSYRLNSRSCLNLRACFSDPPLTLLLVRLFVQHSQILPIFFPVNHMALPYPHASGIFHRSFKSLLASRRSHFRGVGWSHYQNKIKIGQEFDGFITFPQWCGYSCVGMENAEAKNKWATMCGILMFYMKTC